MNDFEEIAYDNIKESQLPAVINEQFEILEKVRKNVGEASNADEVAVKSANASANRKTKLVFNKAAIESLQSTSVDLANAQIKAAEAQEVSFEYQQALANMSKFLFGLGVSNIVANRSVVRELTMRLKGASQEELDDLARQELVGVINQLKAQEDIMKKQQTLKTQVKGHELRLGDLENENNKRNEAIKNLESKDIEHDKRLDESKRIDQLQNEELSRHSAKDLEHDRRLDEGDIKDQFQDEELSRQALRDLEHDEKINELAIKVATLEATCKELAETIELINSTHNNTEEELKTAIESRFTRRASIITMIIGVLGLAAAIINYFV